MLKPANKEELKKIIENRIRTEGPECNLNDIDVSGITDMSELFKESKFDGDISDEISGIVDENEKKDDDVAPLSESEYQKKFRLRLAYVLNVYMEMCKRREAQANKREILKNQLDETDGPLLTDEEIAAISEDDIDDGTN